MESVTPRRKGTRDRTVQENDSAERTTGAAMKGSSWAATTDCRSSLQKVIVCHLSGRDAETIYQGYEKVTRDSATAIVTARRASFAQPICEWTSCDGCGPERSTPAAVPHRR